MARCDRANPNSRNFGLGSRDMAYAGRNALREGMQSHSSIATMADRWSQFASWAREEAGIRDMRHIESATLRGYATHLIERLERGEISPATAQNALSAVNRVLEIARGDRAVRLDPVREAGLPIRSGIATTDRAVSLSQHDTALAALPERLAAILSLQRAFGLRFEEAAKLERLHNVDSHIGLLSRLMMVSLSVGSSHRLTGALICQSSGHHTPGSCVKARGFAPSRPRSLPVACARSRPPAGRSCPPNPCRAQAWASIGAPRPR